MAPEALTSVGSVWLTLACLSRSPVGRTIALKSLSSVTRILMRNKKGNSLQSHEPTYRPYPSNIARGVLSWAIDDGRREVGGGRWDMRYEIRVLDIGYEI